MIIDLHIHSVDAIGEHIFRACLIPEPISREEEEIEKINAEISFQESFRILGFCIVNPEYGISQLDRGIRELGLKGVVLDASTGIDFSRDEVWRLFEEIAELRIPVLIHSEPEIRGFDVEEANEIAISFPEVNIVFSHFGMSLKEDFSRVVPEHNVYYETSGVYPEILMRSLERVPLQNIVFGSNSREAFISEEVEKILSLPLTQEDREKILYRNAARILGIEIPEEKKSRLGFIRKIFNNSSLPENE